MLLAVACSGIQPRERPGEAPARPVPAPVPAVPRPTPTPAPVPVAAPVAKVLAADGAEAALARYRKSLAASRPAVLAVGEAGYYLDVLEARLRQRLVVAEGGIGLQRSGGRLRITLPAQAAFDSGSALPRPGILAELRRVHEAIEPFDKTLLSVHGHTDALGPPAVNRRLSEQRALAVAGYLVERGIDRQRLVAIGHGAALPVASNDTPEGRALNRRVELWIDPLVKE